MNSRKYIPTIVLLLLIADTNAFAGQPKTDTLRFICNELLCKPTATSVAIHACVNKGVDVYCEYGTHSLNYTLQTVPQTSADSIPFVITLYDLTPNTRYFYRLRFREPGGAAFLARKSRTFHTQRSKGTSYTFAIEADPHMDTNSVAAVYSQTLQNILSKNPDFLIDLGDTFMGEKLPTITLEEMRKRYLYLRTFFDQACHSVPLYLVQGNHDGELGWRLDNTANNMPVWATTLRKTYYPNPSPDGFYSGNSKSEPYVGLRENYYAWEWGHALFVVLDPYWHTKTKPGWGWTLGADQYNWLKQTLTTSTAKFKFVFCHQLVGGNGNDARGGIEFARFFENGGRNLDSTWGFDANRPGWQKPIHTLMVENGVQVYFHGHDHFYGKQDLDGVVYQEVPQPSLKNYTTQSAANYGYVNGVILPNRGYLLVTVNDTSAKVEYIRTYLPSEENATRHNGDISHSYTLRPFPAVSVTTEYLPPADDFSLYQNYPNPFNPATTIRYSVNSRPSSVDSRQSVRLDVFDVLGRKVTTLINEEQAPGKYSVSFNAAGLPGGTYFYNICIGNATAARKMLLIK